MSDELTSNLNISLDSLEIDNSKKSSERAGTVLVPFYDGDVLVSIGKDCRTKSLAILLHGTDLKNDHSKSDSSKNKAIKNHNLKTSEPKNYLINAVSAQKQRKNKSYLEKFREKLGQSKNSDERNSSDGAESIRAEYGDTERESAGEASAAGAEYYDTECYNEVFYESLLNHRESDKKSNTFDEVECDMGDVKGSEQGTRAADRPRSASEVPRSSVRGGALATSENVPACRLGGLGPDAVNIRPRLERARSLQRYSEQIRIQNKLKIYSKNVESDQNNQPNRIPRTNRRKAQTYPQTSYLIRDNESKSRDKRTKCGRSPYREAQERCNQKKFSTSSSKRCTKEERLKLDVEPYSARTRTSVPNSKTQKSDKHKVGSYVAAVDYMEGLDLKYDFNIKLKGVSPRITLVNRNRSDVEIELDISGDGDDERCLRVRSGRPWPPGAPGGPCVLSSLEEKHRLYQEAVKKMCIKREEL